jgi:hypothetical protein
LKPDGTGTTGAKVGDRGARRTQARMAAVRPTH